MSDVPTGFLREALRRRSSGPSPECLDSERLAEWYDGALSARERVAVEAHASSCARCQALLAAMARTGAASGMRDEVRGKTGSWRWLAPLAAAAALVLWIMFPSAPLKQIAAPQRVGEPATSAATSTSAAPTPPAAIAQPSAPADRLARTKPGERTNAPESAQVAAARRGRASADERSGAAAGAVRSERQKADGAVQDMRAAAAPQSIVAPAPREDRDAAAAPPATAAARTEPGAESTPTETKPTSAAVAAGATPQNVGRYAGTLSEQVMTLRAGSAAKALMAPTEIVSPNTSVRWRIVTDGTVARSIDRGRTWQPQSTGVTATLTAGAAPSPTICWLVGPRGIVVLSTDGRTWQRVMFPEPIDLASILASDAANATVTAVDGRTFNTTDGGKTWRPRM